MSFTFDNTINSYKQFSVVCLVTSVTEYENGGNYNLIVIILFLPI